MDKTALFRAPENMLCPKCGAELIIRSGKHGAFLGCSNYPQCNYIRTLKQQADGHIIKVLKGKLCPRCNADLALRQGRYGMFISCSGYPQCGHTETINPSDETSIPCPQCRHGKLLQRRSRYGKIFYACNDYPQCQYAVNHTPIEGQCAYCHFPLLIEKTNSRSVKRFCANRACGKSVDSGKNSGS